MESVREDIKEAKRFIHKEIYLNYFARYCTAFLFGTENQEGLSKIIDFKNKDVATVSSSGDQYISHVYYGANRVDTYDINRFTYYITCLKIAAILVLSYEEFLRFFVPARDYVNKDFWNTNTYGKLTALLPWDVALFFDEIIFEGKKYGFGDFVTPQSDKFKKDDVLRGMPFYYDESNYYKLQSLLKVRLDKFPKFYETDILSMGDKFEIKYDIIYLSNIIECLVCEEIMAADNGYGSFFINENEIEEAFLKSIIKEVAKMSKEEATVLIDYRANRSLNECVDYLFNNEYLDVHEIEAKYLHSCDEVNHDLVLTYKKSRSKKF